MSKQASSKKTPASTRSAPTRSAPRRRKAVVSTAVPETESDAASKAASDHSAQTAAPEVPLAGLIDTQRLLALQSEFGVKLIEPHGRGCRLTDEGRLLAEIVAPIITSTSALRKRFEVARGAAEARALGRHCYALEPRDDGDVVVRLVRSAVEADGT